MRRPTRRGALAASCGQKRPAPHVSGQILHHKASIAARGASDRNLYQGVLPTMAACRSRHVSSLANQEAVTDQRCPSAKTNSTTTKLAIATQGRRIVTLATVPKSPARSATPKLPTTRGSRPQTLEGSRRQVSEPASDI